jgi:hypothetical protein
VTKLVGLAIKIGAITCILEKPPFVANAASLLVRGNNLLTVNIVLSERINLVVLLGQCKDIKQILTFGAPIALKLRVNFL